MAYEDCLHVWAGLHSKLGVVGPIFIDELPVVNDVQKKHPNRPNGKRYELLIDRIVAQLHAQLSPEDFRKCWWQQDGASSHTAGDSLGAIQEHFGTRIISRGATLNWPAHSPNLNPLDYWFWAHLRSRLYETDLLHYQERL